MIPQIEQQFSESILEKVASAFGVTREQCKSLGGFESYVYEYTKNHKAYILKITHTLRRDKNYIMGELEWVSFLHERGVSVSKPIPSENGNLIEAIPSENGSFLAIAFEKAKGTDVKKDMWEEALFYTWGKTMGQIHAQTKDYILSNSHYKRQDWSQEEQMNVRQYVPYDEAIIQKVEAILEELESLPKTKDTYGLVHADFHPRNFFVSGDAITLFDFDDCSYTYFINDISIAMYYGIHYPFRQYEDKPGYIKTLFSEFMKGYLSVHPIELDDVDYVDPLIRLRHAMMYIIFHQTHDVHKLNEEGKKLLNQHRSEILSEDAFVPVNFKQVVLDIKNLEIENGRVKKSGFRV